MTQTAIDRSLYIGGSTAQTIILGNVFGKTRKQLWEYYTHKRDVIEFENPDIKRGRRQEAVAAACFTDKTGIELMGWEYAESIYKPPHQFMGGHIDRIDKEMTTLFEIKVPREKTYRSYVEDGIPQHYLVQALHYLALFPSIDKLTFIVYNPMEDDYFTSDVLRDDELIDQIIDVERWFWECVINGVQPADNNSILDLPDTCGEIIAVDDTDHIELIDKYEEVKSYIDQNTEELEYIKDNIRDYMGDRERIKGAGGKIYYTQNKGRKTLKVELITAKYPGIDLSDCYDIGDPYRTLRVYRAKPTPVQAFKRAKNRVDINKVQRATQRNIESLRMAVAKQPEYKK